MLLVVKSSLYICHTHMHIMISCAKIMRDGGYADIILCDSIPGHIELANKLRQAQIFGNVYIFEETKATHNVYRVLRTDFLRNRIVLFKMIVSALFPVRIKAYRDIYIFNDLLYAGQYLRAKNTKYHLIEDGINFWNYICDIEEFNENKNKLQRSIYRFVSNCDCMIDFEVNDKRTLPKNLEINVVEDPKIRLFSSISNSDKEKLIGLFISDSEEKVFNSIKDNSVLILTQPFWEDGSLSEEECVQRYNVLSKKYMIEGYCTIVKPHPRDRNNYICSYELKGDFPIEIICFNETIQRIKAVISVDSTGGSILFEANRNIRNIVIGVEEFYNMKCDSEQINK